MDMRHIAGESIPKGALVYVSAKDDKIYVVPGTERLPKIKKDIQNCAASNPVKGLTLTLRSIRQ